MAKREAMNGTLTLKRFKKIPVYVVEEHNDALQFIYSAIGGKKLPTEGTTLVHLDAHPDMLVGRGLQGAQARGGRALLPLLDIENWIVPAAAAGHVARVLWLRPPWAKQIADGSRVVRVGDHPQTGLLRIGCPEPYFLSDALYSRDLLNERSFELTVAELGDPDCLRPDEEDHVRDLTESLGVSTPYVLDIDLDFFSTNNPFLSLYEEVGLYDRLEALYEFELPGDPAEVGRVVEARELQLDELERLFQCLQDHGSLEPWEGEKTPLYHKVQCLVPLVSGACGEQAPDWQAVHWAGCTRDQGGLPAHRSSPAQLASLAARSLRPLLRALPPPVLVTLARSSRDDYCPPDQVEEIQAMVLRELSAAYDIDEPVLYYLDQ